MLRKLLFGTASIAVALLPLSTIAAPQAPAAPTGLTLCVGANASCAPPAAPTGGKVKWHPGHYILAGYARTNFSDIAGEKYIKGAKVEYDWADLESAKGVYDFSRVEKTLQALKNQGKRLFLTVRYKTFNSHATNGACAPQYVHDMDGVIMKTTNLINGQDPRCIAAVWRPRVADRLIALMEAIGKRFNSDPNFEGVIFPETALGLGNIDVPDLDDVSYVTQLERILVGTKSTFPNTLVIQHGNWLRGDQSLMDGLMAYAEKIGVGFGGPDLMPDRYTMATQNFPKYAGRMPLSIDNQRANRVSGSSVETAFQYAVNDPDGLHANHIFWSTNGSSPWDLQTDILPVINRHNGQINTQCPSNIQCQ